MAVLKIQQNYTGSQWSRLRIVDAYVYLFVTVCDNPNNKTAISIFKFDNPCLTLKEGPKVKSDHTKTLSATDSFRLVSHPNPPSRVCGLPHLIVNL